MKENEFFQINGVGRIPEAFAMTATNRIECHANLFPLNRCERPIIGKNLPATAIYKFFLQDCETKQFIRCDSMWTSDIDEALDFLSAPRAVGFGLKELRTSFQILRIESDVFSIPAVMIVPRLQWSKSPRATGAAYEQRISDQADTASLWSVAFGTEMIAAQAALSRVIPHSHRQLSNS